MWAPATFCPPWPMGLLQVYPPRLLAQLQDLLVLLSLLRGLLLMQGTLVLQ